MKSKKAESPLDKLLLKLMGTLVVNVTSVSRADSYSMEPRGRRLPRR